MTEMRCPVLEEPKRMMDRGVGFRCICGKFLITEMDGVIPEHTVDAEEMRLSSLEEDLVRSAKALLRRESLAPHHVYTSIMKTWAARLVRAARPLSASSGLLRETFEAARDADPETRAAFTALLGDAEDAEKAGICRAFVEGKLFKE